MSGLTVRLAGRRGDLTLDAALEAPPGRVTALVGASAAGKSTLLRAIAGLERLAGEVRLDGETWQDARRFTPAHRRRVGLVFQHGALFPHLTVRGNLDYARRRAGAPGSALDEAADRLGIERLMERSVDRLSGGERRRVALARALAMRPRLLLLDEPLSGVDAEAKAELQPVLRDAFAGLAAPVLYVSHDADEVARTADRVLRLERGRITPGEAPGVDARLLAGRSPEEIGRLAAAALRAGVRA